MTRIVIKKRKMFYKKVCNNYAIKHSNIYCHNITYYVKNIMFNQNPLLIREGLSIYIFMPIIIC